MDLPSPEGTAATLAERVATAPRLSGPESARQRLDGWLAEIAQTPAGAALIHTGKYVGDEPSDPARDRQELEALLDLVQPGWRDVMEAHQFLPSMTVTGGTVTAAAGGLQGRPEPAVSAPHVFIAGDWVGSEGLLSDASFASGNNAAGLAVAAVVRAGEDSRSELSVGRS